MTGKSLIDITDPKFAIPANEDVMRFIRLTNPFAHSDVGDIVFSLAKRIDGAHAYCPAPGSYAYVALHTAENRICAIAYGMQELAFRFAPATRDDALARGAREADSIGADWARIVPWGNTDGMDGPARALYWGQRAFDEAVAKDA